MALALDDRLKVGVAHGEGALTLERRLPRSTSSTSRPGSRSPVLMLAGRYDPFYDVDRRQLLLRLLGTPDKDKRLVFVETGHAVMRSREAMRETLDWLDRYLGPVEIR